MMISSQRSLFSFLFFPFRFCLPHDPTSSTALPQKFILRLFLPTGDTLKTEPCLPCMLSRTHLFPTPWPVAHQAPPSMVFSRPEYWSGVPLPSPGDLPDLGIEPSSPTWQAGSLPLSPLGSQDHVLIHLYTMRLTRFPPQKWYSINSVEQN